MLADAEAARGQISARRGPEPCGGQRPGPLGGTRVPVNRQPASRKPYRGWLRLLPSHFVIGSHCCQSGQARYSGSSKTPIPRW